ncbi:MAG: TlpA disulfide reductase family protein, partial [Bacteroidota bacterium]
YVFEEYTPSQKRMKRLEAGDVVKASLEFPIFNSTESIRIDQQGKLILLDYWYMACPPGMKASSYLNEMYHDYSEKEFMVIGINPFDKKEDKLIEFLEKKNIDYPVSLDLEKKTVDLFGITAYPSFLLIDQTGKIILREDGFSVEIIQKLRSEINKRI